MGFGVVVDVGDGVLDGMAIFPSFYKSIHIPHEIAAIFWSSMMMSICSLH